MTKIGFNIIPFRRVPYLLLVLSPKLDFLIKLFSQLKIYFNAAYNRAAHKKRVRIVLNLKQSI